MGTTVFSATALDRGQPGTETGFSVTALGRDNLLQQRIIVLYSTVRNAATAHEIRDLSHRSVVHSYFHDFIAIALVNHRSLLSEVGWGWVGVGCDGVWWCW
jgi:hypothetical protein